MRRKTGRKSLPKELEREINLHELNAPYFECCDEPLHECGVETSEELKIIPQRSVLFATSALSTLVANVKKHKLNPKSSSYQSPLA